MYNYFSDLKRNGDIEFTLKTEEIDKYMEIIDSIEFIEENYYHSIKPIDLFKNEIKLIYQQLTTEEDNINIDEVKKSIDEIKYNIEKVLFSNKSILIMNYNCGDGVKDKFLLIINDKYLRKNSIDSFRATRVLADEREGCFHENDPVELPFDDSNKNDEIIREEKSFVYYLLHKLKTEENNSDNNVVTIDIGNIEKLYFRKQHIKIIEPSAFNKLKYLKSICFSGNRIEEIHPLIQRID